MKLLRFVAALALLRGTGWAAGSGPAGDPLAVTTLAQPSPRSTPTLRRLERSRRRLDEGMAELRAGRPAKAVQDLDDAVRLDPAAGNYKALGTAYFQAGDRLKAAWAYRESLRLEPDPEVQALVDRLDSGTDAQAASRRALLTRRAAVEARAGQADRAVQDDRDAYALGHDPSTARAALRLAAAAVEGDLARRSLARAVETLCRVAPLRRARGLGAGAAPALARLGAEERRVVRWSGRSLADNQKAMLADHDAWLRTMKDRAAAGEGGR